MKRMLLIALFMNALLMFVHVEPLASGECEDRSPETVTTVMPLEQDESVPCPAGVLPQPVTPEATLTATSVLMPTVTLTSSTDGTIIPPVATARHTAKTVEATSVTPEVGDGAVIYTLIRQLGQLLMGLPLRGVILPLPPIDLHVYWQWVMWLLETWLK